ncbi:hypothetical protein Hanom_Chr14g01319631 [Helianthus anomalus]
MNESVRPRNTRLSFSHHFSFSLSMFSAPLLPSSPINRFHNLSDSGSRSTLGRWFRFLIGSNGIMASLPLCRTSSFCCFLLPSYMHSLSSLYVISSTTENSTFCFLGLPAQIARIIYSNIISFSKWIKWVQKIISWFGGRLNGLKEIRCSQNVHLLLFLWIAGKVLRNCYDVAEASHSIQLTFGYKNLVLLLGKL